MFEARARLICDLETSNQRNSLLRPKILREFLLKKVGLSNFIFSTEYKYCYYSIQGQQLVLAVAGIPTGKVGAILIEVARNNHACDFFTELT
eukprot:3935393-Rhodomonas_salina.1